jgi:catechol 2,3-dioxygenase-like lactoylglutathione lyase family enzyme
VFDRVGIAVSDLAASERFYRTVLSVLGVDTGEVELKRFGLDAVLPNVPGLPLDLRDATPLEVVVLADGIADVESDGELVSELGPAPCSSAARWSRGPRSGSRRRPSSGEELSARPLRA